MATRRNRATPAGIKGASRAGRALLVAINDYGDPQNNLPSCLEDAAQFREVLQSQYGFEDITELYDGDATAANVEVGLERLFEDVADDERLVFFYSGHGYQQPGDGTLEECLVLSGLEFFFDDRLSELSQSAPPGALTVVLDSCFSGGMEKRIPTAKGLEIARTKRWMPPADEPESKSLTGSILVPRPFGCFPITRPDAVKRLALGAQAGPNAKSASPQAASDDETGQLQLNGLLLSACSENETASAGTSTTEGMSAFTCALMRTLPASGDIAVAQLHQGIRDELAEMGFQQTPLLRTPADPSGLANASFVTLAPAAETAEQPAKALPARFGSTSTTTLQPREDRTMTTRQANDPQFWRAVERVAAQVAVASRSEAPAGRKGFSPGSRASNSSQVSGADSEPMIPSSRAAGGGRGAPGAGRMAGRTNGRTAGRTAPASAGTTVAMDDDQWIGAALSLVEPVAVSLIDAIQDGRLDTDVGEDKLTRAVSSVVTPAVIDAIGERPEDFAFGTPDDEGAAGDDEASPLDAMARVVAASVSSIVAEVAKGEDTAAESAPPAGEGAEGEKIVPALIAAGATLAAPVVWHAIDAWRKRRRRKGLGEAPDDAMGEEEGMPA
ncbi:MAG: caspase domain-containing protein, partial [Reyranella sp.]|uniref:caspase family protein n=1 Tax=Reyranella sp. TaxID=1929291 RepID=UPI003D0AF3ED